MNGRALSLLTSNADVAVHAVAGGVPRLLMSLDTRRGFREAENLGALLRFLRMPDDDIVDDVAHRSA